MAFCGYNRDVIQQELLGFEVCAGAHCQRLSVAVLSAGSTLLFLEALRYLVELILTLKLEGGLGKLRWK